MGHKKNIMKISQFFPLACFAWVDQQRYEGGGKPINYDKWPSGIDNLGQLFRSMPDHRDQTPLKTAGDIPEWISGSFYRNGPAIYEWGNSSYKHMFDPSGILQRFEIHQGAVQYNSRFIESRNYWGNKAAADIIYPEVGTYAEFENVTHHANGSPIESEAIIKKNRLAFNLKYGTTPNTLVSIIPFHGWMMSMTETSVAHLHDPFTLEVIHVLDFADSPNLPKELKLITMSAHGTIDINDGAWYDSGMGLDTSEIVPKSGHLVIRSKNACSSNIFGNPMSPEEILANLEFSTLLPEKHEDPLDTSISYFHMFGSTANHIVLPFLSVSIDSKTMTQLMVNGEPIIGAFEYNDKVIAEYQLFSKKDFKFVSKRYATSPSFFAHLINAYEENDEIVFETLLASNCDIFSLFQFKYINQTGSALEEFYKTITPAGTPVSYRFPIDEKEAQVDAVPMFENSSDWQSFEHGGVEFPVTDFAHKFGSKADHFWACGFGAVMPDRLYHANIATGDRYVYKVEGYSPCEPAFIKKPGNDIEDDGVVVTLMSPMSDPTLKPFMAVLNATTMHEMGRAFTPDGINIPLGFHGGWVDHSVPHVRTSSSELFNSICLFFLAVYLL